MATTTDQTGEQTAATADARARRQIGVGWIVRCFGTLIVLLLLIAYFTVRSPLSTSLTPWAGAPITMVVPARGQATAGRPRHGWDSAAICGSWRLIYCSW